MLSNTFEALLSICVAESLYTSVSLSPTLIRILYIVDSMSTKFYSFIYIYI